MRPSRPRLVLAVSVLVGAWAPALASVALAWTFALPELPVPGAFLAASPPIIQSRFDDIGVTVALIYGPLAAALIATRRHPVTIILVVHAVGSALAAFGVQWGLLAQEVVGLPAVGLLLHAAGWGYLPGTIATTIVPLLVMPGRPSPRDRALIALGIALAAAGTLVGVVHQAPGAPANPFAIPGDDLQAALPGAYAAIVTGAIALSLVVSVLTLGRWRRSTGVVRGRLGWLATGHLFLTLSYGALILPSGVAVPELVWDFGMLAPVLGQIFYPSAVLVLVLGPRLRAIGVAVTGILTATILAIAAAAGYAMLAHLGGLTGMREPAVGIAAALIVAVALVPARDRLQRGVERLVWGGEGDPAQLARRLGERVGELESGGAGLTQVAEALRVATRLGGVAIRASAPGGPHAVSGRVTEPITRVPLQAGGSLVGVLEVTDPDGRRLSRSTRRDLAGLAPVLAVVLRLVEANAELAVARDEVSAARHAERRVLRRELHDGVGPALAGIGFGLAAVDRRLDDDPLSARRLTRRLADDLTSRVRDVRALVRAIGADDGAHDLSADLRELARDFGDGAGLAMDVQLDDADLVPVDARRALSLVASEAVHNAVRHAAARRVLLAVRRTGDGVMLEVTDDGRGFDPRVRVDGIGLATMRERVAALGGRLHFDTAPGRGTSILVSLPLPPDPLPTSEVPA